VGYAELLHDGAGGSLGDDQARLVEGIERGAARLRELVDELLDFARVEAGKFGLLPEPQDLMALIDTALEPYRDVAAKAGLALERAPLDRPLSVLAVLAGARQAHRHLRDIAVTGSPEVGQVSVRSCLDGGAARIEVADTGPGIAEDHLARVFDKFYQVDGSTTRAKDGTGLGLAVAKAIVEAHGGRIGADSRLGAGSTFWLTLPVAEAPMGKMGPGAVE
jgi:signal transduction histidine kinase